MKIKLLKKHNLITVLIIVFTFSVFSAYAMPGMQPKVVWKKSGLSVQQRANEDGIPVYNIYYMHRPLIEKEVHGFNGVYTANTADNSLIAAALFSDDGGHYSSVYAFSISGGGTIKKIDSPFKGKGDLPVNIRQKDDVINLFRFASIQNDTFDVNIDFELFKFELTSDAWIPIKISRHPNSKDVIANKLYQADMAFKKGRYNQASKAFKKLSEDSAVKKSFPEIQAMSLYYLAKSYAFSDKPEEAVISYEDFVNEFSSHAFADMAQAESEFLDMARRFNSQLLTGYLAAQGAYFSSKNTAALSLIESALESYVPSKDDVYIQNLLGRAFYLGAQLNHKAGNLERAAFLYEKGSLFNCEPSVKRQCIAALKKLK